MYFLGVNALNCRSSIAHLAATGTIMGNWVVAWWHGGSSSSGWRGSRWHLVVVIVVFDENRLINSILEQFGEECCFLLWFQFFFFILVAVTSNIPHTTPYQPKKKKRKVLLKPSSLHHSRRHFISTFKVTNTDQRKWRQYVYFRCATAAYDIRPRVAVVGSCTVFCQHLIEGLPSPSPPLSVVPSDSLSSFFEI